MMALSATTFKPLYLTWFAEKPKEAPVPLILGNMDEKRSLDSSSSSVTGAQVPPKTTTQRKVSEEKTAKAEQENGKV
jgi:hypothetical protein